MLRSRRWSVFNGICVGTLIEMLVKLKNLTRQNWWIIFLNNSKFKVLVPIISDTMIEFSEIITFLLKYVYKKIKIDTASSLGVGHSFGKCDVWRVMINSLCKITVLSKLSESNIQQIVNFKVFYLLENCRFFLEIRMTFKRHPYQMLHGNFILFEPVLEEILLKKGIWI